MFTFKKDVTKNLSANLAVNIIGIFGVIGSLIFLALEVNIAQESLSFSITINFFGFFSKIFFVKLPVPGPISKIDLFLISTVLIILSIIF